jgi:hypothetical protein
MLKLLGLVLIATLAGCTSESGPESAKPLVEATGRNSAVVTDEPAGTLVVRQRYRERSSFYIEGSVGFVEVAQPGVDAVTRLERQLEGDASVRLVLAPGVYSITSWQRPCDGNCQDGFDPPVDGCETSISIDSGDTTRAAVTVTPDQGCLITVRAAD